MLSILYTGGLLANQQQSIGTSSMGGYISLTPIPNGRANSLFSDTCYYQKNTTECRLIGIKAQAAVTSLQIWINNQDPLVSYEVAVVAPTADVCGDLCFEKLSKSSDIPLYAVFTETNINTPIIIGNLVVNQIIGLWIKRTYDSNSLVAIENRSCEVLSMLPDTVPTSIQKTFSIEFDFT